MNIRIKNIVDTNGLQRLFESFTNLTGMVSAVLDLNGNIFVSTGWQDICTRFHRAHPEASLRCKESDTDLARQLKLGEKYTVYYCKNGLLDAAVPIVVNGVHIGNIFTGQFFFQPPDIEFFKKQAARFGFNEGAYLEALSRVPILSQEKVRKTMDFLSQVAAVMGEMGLTRLKLLKANRQLELKLDDARKELGMTARFTFDNLISGSHEIKQLVERAKTIADSPSTVLLLGESGTGKEVLAQGIHNCSNRRHLPFVAVNCGAIPKELIQSELFGYEKGAFTGADKHGRAGKFEVAGGGTLFLDEIGDMPIEMQTNLLRVLDERTVVRVGGTEPISVDVRLIAATHRDLPAQIKKRLFRSDLYYRLSVIQLSIPPLRERTEDIIPIAEYHMARISKKLDRNIARIDSDALNSLMGYNWPGNIRELVNVIEQAVILAPGDVIRNEHLPKYVQDSCSGAHSPRSLTPSVYKSTTLADLEKWAINDAISHHRGNLTKAARALGIGRNTLYDKIKRYNLQR